MELLSRGNAWVMSSLDPFTMLISTASSLPCDLLLFYPTIQGPHCNDFTKTSAGLHMPVESGTWCSKRDWKTRMVCSSRFTNFCLKYGDVFFTSIFQEVNDAVNVGPMRTPSSSIVCGTQLIFRKKR